MPHRPFTCREDHPQLLIDSISSIITSILVENVGADPDPLKRNTFQPLLDVLLRNVIKEKKVIFRTSIVVLSMTPPEVIFCR